MPAEPPTPPGASRSSLAPHGPPTPPPPPQPRGNAETVPPRGEAWRGEIDVLAREAEALRERDPARTALLHGARAVLCAAALGDGQAAKSALDAAAELTSERWVMMLRRREALSARSWDRAQELAQTELPLVGDARERVALLIEMAAVEEVSRANLAEARGLLDGARELAPTHPAVLQALAELSLVAKQWDRLVAVLQAQADATHDARVRSMLRHAAGQVQQVRLSNPQAARASLKLALTEHPENLAAVIDLASLSRAQEDWGELARALCAEAELIDEPTAIRHLTERAGDLYWERLGDAESAAASYRQAALAAPEDPAPLRRLTAVLESTGKWRELIDVYVAELRLQQDPLERAELYHRIGEIHETSLGSVDDAIAAYQQALSAEPAHAPTIEALTSLFERVDRGADLVQMELREAERVADPAGRAARYFDIAERLMQRSGDSAEAVRLYERCLDLHPGHRGAFGALERLYRGAQRWADRAALFQRQAAVVNEPALVRAYHHEIACMWRDRVPQPDKAIAAARAALAIESPDLGPLFTLIQVLEDAQRWEALLEALERLTSRLSDPPDAVATLQRIAQVAEIQLGQDERALVAHGQVLERDPGNAVSLRALTRLHLRASRWTDVVSTLRRQLPLAEGRPAEQASLHFRIGRVLERRLGRRDDALAAYEAALEQDPGHSPSMRAIDRLLRRDRLWPRLAAVLERQAAAALSPRSQAERLYAVGQLRELHLGDLEGAERAYAAARELDPELGATSLALAQVREARGDWEGLGALYQEELGHTNQPGARAALLARQATVLELRRDDPGAAARLYGEACAAAPVGLSLAWCELRATRLAGGVAATIAPLRELGERIEDPRLAHGLRTLAALREELTDEKASSAAFLSAQAVGEHDPLVCDGAIRALYRDPSREDALERLGDSLSERAKLCEHAPARALLLFEAACLSDRIGRSREAALAYEAAEGAVPDLLPIVRGVRRIALGDGQWAAAAALLAHEAEICADPENRTAAALASGEISLTRLNDPRGSLAAYRRLLSTQPANERAFARASALCDRLGDHAGLLELLQARAAATEDREERAVLLRQQAQLLQDRLGDPKAAALVLREAIVLRPEDAQGHLLLGGLEEQLGWWQDAVATYQRLAELSGGTDTGRTAHLKEAEIRQRELGDREGARLILEELIVDPNDREAACLMAELCERMGRWDRAQEAWTQLARSRKPIERADALLGLGRVLAVLEDDAGAAAAYEESFALAVAHPPVVTLLERRFAASRDWNTFVGAGERALQQARVVASPQVGLRLAVARVYIDELRRADLAEPHLLAAASLAPEDPRPLMRLAQLHLQAGRTDLAVPELRSALSTAPFHPEALRGLAEAYVCEGLPDAGRMMEEVAALAQESSAPASSLGPLPVRRPLQPEELPVYLPRTEEGPTRALAEVMRQLEPYAAALIAESMQGAPTGDQLADGHAVAVRCRALAAAVGVEAGRVFADPEAREVRYVSDGTLALRIPSHLVAPAAQGRLSFEVARLLSWRAFGATLGAYLAVERVGPFLEAIAIEGSDEELKDLRRRTGKVLPRRVRKEIERVFTAELPHVRRDAPLWHAEERRRATRLALLLSRDGYAAFETIAGRGGAAHLGATAETVELLDWLTSEACWRLYLRMGATT